MTKSCYCHLKSLGRLRPFLTQKTANTIAMSLIMSRMGYCNNTPWGLPANQLNHLQKILNAAACIVTRGNSQYITSVLKSLHCLPISNTNRLSLTQYVYKLYHNASNETSYPMQSISFSLILFPEPTNHLWFQRAHTHKNSLCTNSSHSAAPTLWNRLPGTLLNAEDIVFLAAADFFSNSLVTYPPHSSFPSHSCIPLLTVPSTLPFSTTFPKDNEHVGV